MTAFIHGTKTVGISGGNFRQTSYNEQHEHHTRVSREDKTIIQGNIYGYTHTATSDDGPIIAYSHTTNVTRPQYDGRAFLSIPRGGPTHGLPVNDTPLLGDGTEHRSYNRDMAAERRPPFLFPETQHHTSEPLTYPDLNDQKLKAEFHTLSPDMQRYVVFMLGQLEKRLAASGDTTKALENVALGTRGQIAGLANQKPFDIHSHSGSRETYHVGNSISDKPITSSPQSHSLDHGAPEIQSLSDAKPCMAIKTQDDRLSKATAPDVAPILQHSPEAKGSLMKNIGTFIRKARSLSKIFARHT